MPQREPWQLPSTFPAGHAQSTGMFLQHWQCTARVKNSQLLYPLFVGALEKDDSGDDASMGILSTVRPSGRSDPTHTSEKLQCNDAVQHFS